MPRTTIGLGLLLAASCATAAAKPSEVVWPLPPDQPRVRFVRAIASEEDLGLSGWQAFWRAVTGAKSSYPMIQPMGLALSNDEQRLYVSNPPASLVLEIDFAQKKVRAVANATGYEVQYPFGVALDAEDNLYVADSKRRSVMVYGKGGAFLRELGAGKFDRPTGIAIDRKRGVVYVADGSSRDSEHHCVLVFTPAGDLVHTLGKKGSADGELYYPVYLAIAPNGNLYVGDTMNFRVQVFDPEGRFVMKYGEQGDAVGQFARIKGLAFDAFGNLHVADGEFAVVQIFNSKLQPLMFYGGRANKLEFFDMPTGIVIDSKNNIYVANFMNARVNQYEIINTTAADSYVGSAVLPALPDVSPAKVE